MTGKRLTSKIQVANIVVLQGEGEEEIIVTKSHHASGVRSTVRIPTLEAVQKYEQALYTSSSSVLLKNTTIAHLKQLHLHMHLSDEESLSYDSLVLELIRVYRKVKKV